MLPGKGRKAAMLTGRRDRFPEPASATPGEPHRPILTPISGKSVASVRGAGLPASATPATRAPAPKRSTNRFRS
jgi:hypothetical protein